jgi:hypothetical protein
MKKFLLFSLFCLSVAHAGDHLLDPTAPLGENTHDKKKMSFQNITLNAIIKGPTSTSAIINGHTLTEGETIGLVKVLSISTRSVTVESETGETKVLQLFAQDWLTKNEGTSDV